MRIVAALLKFIISGLMFVVIVGGLAGCVSYMTMLPDVKADVTGADARPPLSYATVADWEADKPALKAAFQNHVYGVFPETGETLKTERKTLDENYLERGVLEEWRLETSASYAEGNTTTQSFHMVVTTPKNAADAPVIIMQTFAPNDCVLPHPDVTRLNEQSFCDGGFMSSVGTFVFGRYIARPPLEELLERGYAVASLYPAELVPDNGGNGMRALYGLTEGYEDDDTRLGAIGAWAWGFSRMVDALEDDPRIDTGRMIVFGHSRYGKAALLAAAMDERIDGVISHQSGTGGAALNRDKVGESITGMTGSYPHWFPPVYASYGDDPSAMPVDQHQLIAMVAPRPALLGNARRDQWSDPEGTFRAAAGADPIYELYGTEGLQQGNLEDFNPAAPLAFSQRGGTHGVTEDDWPLFFDWLEVHFEE